MSNEELDPRTIKQIISGAVSRALNTKVERIIEVKPKRTATSEQILALNPQLTKESLISALLEDPRVDSAEFRAGRFHFKAGGKTVSFNFKFEDEKGSGSALPLR